jgi:hypothetical protein
MEGVLNSREASVLRIILSEDALTLAGSIDGFVPGN